MKKCLIFGLTSFISIIAITHFNSKAYLEKQYYTIYTSTYLTKEERKAIMRDSHTLAILPDEFDKDPKRVKEIIKKNNKSLLF